MSGPPGVRVINTQQDKDAAYQKALAVDPKSATVVASWGVFGPAPQAEAMEKIGPPAGASTVDWEERKKLAAAQAERDRLAARVQRGFGTPGDPRRAALAGSPVLGLQVGLEKAGWSQAQIDALRQQIRARGLPPDVRPDIAQLFFDFAAVGDRTGRQYRPPPPGVEQLLRKVLGRKSGEYLAQGDLDMLAGSLRGRADLGLTAREDDELRHYLSDTGRRVSPAGPAAELNRDDPDELREQRIARDQAEYRKENPNSYDRMVGDGERIGRAISPTGTSPLQAVAAIAYMADGMDAQTAMEKGAVVASVPILVAPKGGATTGVGGSVAAPESRTGALARPAGTGGAPPTKGGAPPAGGGGNFIAPKVGSGEITLDTGLPQRPLPKVKLTTPEPAPAQVGGSRGEQREPTMLKELPKGSQLLPPRSEAVDAVRGGKASYTVTVEKLGTQKILVVNVHYSGGVWTSMKSMEVPTKQNIRADIDIALKKIDRLLTHGPSRLPARTPAPTEGSNVYGRVHLEGTPDFVEIHVELPTLKGNEELVTFAQQTGQELRAAYEITTPVTVLVTGRE